MEKDAKNTHAFETSFTILPWKPIAQRVLNSDQSCCTGKILNIYLRIASNQSKFPEKWNSNAPKSEFLKMLPDKKDFFCNSDTKICDSANPDKKVIAENNMITILNVGITGILKVLDIEAQKRSKP